MRTCSFSKINKTFPQQIEEKLVKMFLEIHTIISSINNLSKNTICNLQLEKVMEKVQLKN